jgi:ABC-type uncharacterized transport system ATPase subunit
VSQATEIRSPAASRGADSSVILETKDLSVQFGGLAALSCVNFSVARSQTHAIIGPNGAGKSTFFNCLTGVLTPTGGRIIFDGEDITGLPSNEISRKGIARSYQITNIMPNASVMENVRIAAQSRRHAWNMLAHHDAWPRSGLPPTLMRSRPIFRTVLSEIWRLASRLPLSRSFSALTSRPPA